MSEPSREYIECRIFILGDEKVGKKSFVKKILNLPSTSIIRNKEAENDYNKLYLEYKEQVEQERQRQIQQQELLKSINEANKLKNENDKTSKLNSTRSLFRIDEEKTLSRKTSSNFNNKTDKGKINTTMSNKVQNTNTGIISLSSLKSKKIFRPPVPEYPAKLYCVNLNKIIIKLFYIPTAEKMPSSDYIPRDDDEDFVLEKEHNISFEGVRKDINEKLAIRDTIIAQDKLYGFNTYVFTLFVFMYDLSSFYSFESLIIYYSKIAKIYHLGEEENIKACIIGNKIDKKILLEKDQENVYNEFLKNTQLKKFEISTKPYFVFDKFFMDFFVQNFSSFNMNQTDSLSNQKIFEDVNFIEQFKKLLRSKSNFSRSARSQTISLVYSPGPEYNINLYSFNSIEEIKDIFSNKKSRFNKKIFANKKGPILCNDTTAKDLSNKDKEINFNIPIKGGLFNKPIKGYSFGILNGRYNLVQKRKDLRNKRNIDFQENIDAYNNSPLNKIPLKQSKDEEYFENVLKRKNDIHENIVKERNLKMGKILALHNENLKKIQIQKKISNNRILNSHNSILQKSASSPNILFNSISSLDELNKQRNLKRQRYHEVIYSKNKEHLEKYNEKLSHIRLLSSMRREPPPYYIDIREKILNPSKGRSILERFKIVDKKEKGPEYQKLKDEFEKIAEKATNFRPSYGERFISPEKIREQKEKEEKSFEEYEKREEEKRRKQEKNRENSERIMKIRILKDDRRQKLNKHNDLMKSEQIKREAIKELRREISIQKGYGDPNIINPINYSQVEESAPKYSMKGRYIIHEPRNDDLGNIFLGADLEKLNYIKEIQKNEPLPNFNYIKKNMPRVIFNKAERFPKQKNQYEDSVLLFEDGIFHPNTHQDFNYKEPMDNMSQRGGILSSEYKKSPSPADYNIKSKFDVIVEEGKKISEIKSKIKLKNSMEIKRRQNIKENEENNSIESNSGKLFPLLESNKKNNK